MKKNLMLCALLLSVLLSGCAAEPLQGLCGASGKQYRKQERAQHEILFHGMTSYGCFSHIVRMHLVFFNCAACIFSF